MWTRLGLICFYGRHTQSMFAFALCLTLILILSNMSLISNQIALLPLFDVKPHYQGGEISAMQMTEVGAKASSKSLDGT